MATKKGVKVFKLAKDLLVSHTEIIEYLQKNGYKKVKSPMSVVDDDMLELVFERFSKEKKFSDLYLKQKVEKGKADETEIEAKLREDEAAEAAEAAKQAEKEKKAKKTKKAKKEDDEEKERLEKEKEETKAARRMAAAKKLKTKLPAPEKPYDVFEDIDSQVEKVKDKISQSDPEEDNEAKKRGRKKVEAVETSEDGTKKKRRKKRKKVQVDEQKVKDAIKETMSKMDDARTLGTERHKRKRKRKAEREAEAAMLEGEVDETLLRVTEFISVNELANLMDAEAVEIIKSCMEIGLVVTINQRLDEDTIRLIAGEYGFEVEILDEFVDEEIEDQDDEGERVARPPIVTIMGHVDHGKTSLLDYIRNANVVAGESGGITQHIGAYEVELNDDKKITFLDTPGHEAFTAMRARGAQVTDIVVIVVAADDSVRPQTIEAINHAQAAGVPIVIAINKIDRPEANTDKIKTQLADKNVLVEDWGGKHQCVEISAKMGTNIQELLEKIVLEAEILELKASITLRARASVVEAQLDKGRGATATIIVERGILRVGQPFICGLFAGKLKAMYDVRGHKLKEAAPGMPVQVIGFDGVPQAGDRFMVTNSEKEAKEIAGKRQQLKREQDYRKVQHITLDEISKQAKLGKVVSLPMIIKGDVDGSVEALSDSILKLNHEEVNINIIHKGVGAITESDVLLATASNAVIVGFNIRPTFNARKLAEKESIDIRYYNVIYDCIEDIHKALEGMLEPEYKEEITGTLEIRNLFKISRIGTIGGCHVLDGKIAKSNPVRLIRNGEVVYEGKITSLKRFKDDVREVSSGFE